ncbi:hypothetical protein PCC7418_0856 [Halothece sp. PCC 7418]|uniref:HpsJ-like protein, cyanoexosortase A-associated n=1 Tax=Halothece sp. (strain PCC 7418) TaxID=65093 RepID=UPI0002A06665|nr:HpsJ family protein [Halothece sp. PCC 7418]AFZ43071.1 hypothetical protein PCC7418_0856 [Halothece sp. PCC 7418]
MKRNLFGSKSSSNSNRRRRPFWKKFPALELPRLHLGRKLKRLRLPQPPEISLHRLRRNLPRLSTPNLRLPRLRNPFTTISIGTVENQGFFILLNWLGYIILFVSVIDYVRVLYPPQLTNSNWEFETFILLVNNTWLVLLALILIYLPNRAQIRRFELSFLKLLRWLTLLGGIIFILLVPLTLVNANRLNENATAQLGQQQTNQQEQLNNLKEALENESLSFFQLQRLRDQFNIENVPESSTLEQTLIQKIEERKQRIRQQVNTEKQNRFRELLVEAIRNSFAGLLIGAFLIRLWWEARWVKSLK